MSLQDFDNILSDIHMTLCSLEHGTLPFLDILSLRHGFSTMLKIGGSMQQITQHTFQLARIVYNELKALCHHNGQPVCHMYCSGDYSDSAKQGGIVNFNILDEKGHYVGYSQVQYVCMYIGLLCTVYWYTLFFVGCIFCRL